MDEFGISLKEAQKFIDTRKVYVNGKPLLDKSATVEGDVEVVVFEPVSLGLNPLFEHRDFALFDKPSGLMVHPKNRQSGYTLIDEVKSLYGMEANIAHRIDKETSGLVLISRDKKSEKRIKPLFEKRDIKKSYLALVKGRVAKELVIDEPIMKNRDFSLIKLKVYIDPRGKPSKTLVRPVVYIGGDTLVEAIPLTGRQHQIRVHLFHVKHPIVGDPVYGVDTDVSVRYLNGELDIGERIKETGASRLMLHAQSLSFKYLETSYKIVSALGFERECQTLKKGFSGP